MCPLSSWGAVLLIAKQSLLFGEWEKWNNNVLGLWWRRSELCLNIIRYRTPVWHGVVNEAESIWICKNIYSYLIWCVERAEKWRHQHDDGQTRESFVHQVFKPGYRVRAKMLCVSVFIAATEILEISTFCGNVAKQISDEIRFIYWFHNQPKLFRKNKYFLVNSEKMFYVFYKLYFKLVLARKKS